MFLLLCRFGLVSTGGKDDRDGDLLGNVVSGYDNARLLNGGAPPLEVVEAAGAEAGGAGAALSSE